jgi:hypothetical protein
MYDSVFLMRKGGVTLHGCVEAGRAAFLSSSIVECDELHSNWARCRKTQNQVGEEDQIVELSFSAEYKVGL